MLLCNTVAEARTRYSRPHSTLLRVDIERVTDNEVDLGALAATRATFCAICVMNLRDWSFSRARET